MKLLSLVPSNLAKLEGKQKQNKIKNNSAIQKPNGNCWGFFGGILTIFKFNDVFWSFYRFQGYFKIFKVLGSFR